MSQSDNRFPSEDDGARYRRMVDGVTDYAIILFGKDERVQIWNRGAERILGFTEDEAIGRHARFIFTPPDQATNEAEKELDGARQVGRSSDERWHVRKDGSRFWARGILTAMHDEHGEITGFVKVMRDDTDRKLASEQVEISRREAEAANQAKDQFIATVSHELRTPLSVILLWTKMILNQTLGPAQLREAILAIQRSADLQKRLIDDLLDTSRIVSGKLRLEPRLADPTTIVQLAIDEVAPSAANKQITIVRRITADAKRFVADPERVRQILLNLLVNAVKFTPDHGQVEVELSQTEDALRFVVSDNGRGITPDLLPYVFDRFRQGDSAQSRSHGGMGLGLHIAKQLAELHGGSMTAHSDGDGKGATFTVELPLAAETAAEPSPLIDQATLQGAPDAKCLAGTTVLVVEDDEQTRRILEKILTNYGATVILTSGPVLGMEQFIRVRPDLIISDIGMPNIDGYAFMTQLRGWEQTNGWSPTPAIALTAFTREADFDRALEAGFGKCLGKPVDLEHLIETCRQMLKRTNG